MLRYPQETYSTNKQIFTRQDARDKARSMKATGWPKARAVQIGVERTDDQHTLSYVWVVAATPELFLLINGTIGKG